ncbi:MAG: DNA-binding protein [Aphanothece sp. CMT-3BRIN-NPC111]|nr:DNA-binding protein [Aphanothece sp. CMT-3BRIN-NPC111]
MKHKKAKGAHAKEKEIYLLPFYFLLLGGLFSCGTLPNSGASVSPSRNVLITNICDIKRKQDANCAIYLKGKVSNQATFVGKGAYELQDSTGSIWVVTNRSLPAIGDQVLIAGKVLYQRIPIGGKDLGEVYIQEQAQLERTLAQKRLERKP